MLTSPYISTATLLRSSVTAIKHIDMYYSQYLYANSAKELPFNRPAVFIEYGDCRWESYGRAGEQQADTTITLHCVTDILTDTMNIDLKDSDRQDTLMAPLTFDSDIHEAVQGFCPDSCCREMIRIDTQYAREHTGIIVVKHIYSTRMVEQTNNPATQKVTVTAVGASGEVVPALTVATDDGPPIRIS